MRNSAASLCMSSDSHSPFFTTAAKRPLCVASVCTCDCCAAVFNLLQHAGVTVSLLKSNGQLLELKTEANTCDPSAGSQSSKHV